MAVASASAHPRISVLVIEPFASGCLAIASAALDVAIPIPIPAPKPVNTARPAPIAIKPVIIIVLLFNYAFCSFSAAHLFFIIFIISFFSHVPFS